VPRRWHLIPNVFHTVEEEFRNELVAYGYVESRKEYESWLKKGAVVISTAIQGNFGISVVEAGVA
jgi:glycerol-3-phosphate responsive antiterminator